MNLMHTRFVLSSIFLILLLSLPFVFKPYAVSQTSMEPVLADGDIVLVDRVSLRFFSPHRGEIVVLRNPHKLGETDVKRVVGLSSENVQVRTTDIVITHADGSEETFASSTTIGGGMRGANGVSFTMKLGSEDYFVLGDNRESSRDSRFFGAAQSADFIGRPIVRVWPLSRFTFSP